jgi:hypothetical protein
VEARFLFKEVAFGHIEVDLAQHVGEPGSGLVPFCDIAEADHSVVGGQ